VTTRERQRRKAGFYEGATATLNEPPDNTGRLHRAVCLHKSALGQAPYRPLSTNPRHKLKYAYKAAWTRDILCLRLRHFLAKNKHKKTLFGLFQSTVTCDLRTVHTLSKKVKRLREKSQMLSNCKCAKVHNDKISTSSHQFGQKQ